MVPSDGGDFPGNQTASNEPVEMVEKMMIDQILVVTSD